MSFANAPNSFRYYVSIVYGTIEISLNLMLSMLILMVFLFDIANFSFRGVFSIDFSIRLIAGRRGAKLTMRLKRSLRSVSGGGWG
jgi:uncharacterized protein HemY